VAHSAKLTLHLGSLEQRVAQLVVFTPEFRQLNFEGMVWTGGFNRTGMTQG
jgi:hypothetical protein